MDEEARRVRDSGADYASLPQESIPDSEELGVVEPDEVPPEDNRTMLLFCPVCHNLLTADRSEPSETHPSGQAQMTCHTCPYQYILRKGMYESIKVKQKEVEDVLGDENSWDNVDSTEVQCPSERCDGARAFFYQVQIRSADEPMTTFYKCKECGHRWREG